MITRYDMLALSKEQLIALLERRTATILSYVDARNLLARAVEDGTIGADTMVEFFGMTAEAITSLASDQEKIISGQAASAPLN